MKVINYLNGEQYHPNFQAKDQIPLDWTGWAKDYSQAYGVEAFRDGQGYLVLRKKHEYKGVNHYHYVRAESIKLGSVCEHCDEKSTKLIECHNSQDEFSSRGKTRDFFKTHRCEEYGCCYEERLCVHRYIANHLYWSITSDCYIATDGEFKIND